MCLIAGSLYGATSPVSTFSECFTPTFHLQKAQICPSLSNTKRAIFIVEGSVEFRPDGGVYNAGQLLVLKPKQEITLVTRSNTARLVLLGGEPLDGERHIWWNFVSSSRERIEQAKEDCRMEHFAPVPAEIEIILLPMDSRPNVVRYT